MDQGPGDFESPASTSFTTPAKVFLIYDKISESQAKSPFYRGIYLDILSANIDIKSSNPD